MLSHVCRTTAAKPIQLVPKMGEREVNRQILCAGLGPHSLPRRPGCETRDDPAIPVIGKAQGSLRFKR